MRSSNKTIATTIAKDVWHRDKGWERVTLSVELEIDGSSDHRPAGGEGLPEQERDLVPHARRRCYSCVPHNLSVNGYSYPGALSCAGHANAGQQPVAHNGR
jgi:hypothetical protein